MPASQAGRRGFDPRLPLLIFKSFQPSKFECSPNAAHSLLVDQSRLEGIHRINSAFQRGLGIDVDIHV
jgi:hypothetical protein